MRTVTILLTALALAAPALATQSSKTTCETLLADNTSGAISPQDLRDCTTESVLFLDGTSTANLIINEAGSALDVRAESDTDTHILFIDGSANAIGISDSTPTAGKLTIGLDVDFETDNTHDIGTATNRAQDVYALALKADDSGTAVTIPAIDNNGSAISFQDIGRFPDGVAVTCSALSVTGDTSSNSGISLDGTETSICSSGVAALHIQTTAAWLSKSLYPNSLTGAYGLGRLTSDAKFGWAALKPDSGLASTDCDNVNEVGAIYMYDNGANAKGLCVCRQTGASSFSFASLDGTVTCPS